MHKYYADGKNFTENDWNSGKNMYLNFTIKFSFLDGINYWGWGNFRKQFW